MLMFIVHWLVSGVAVYATASLVTGFKVEGFMSACIAALAIGFVNACLGPIFILLTLPVNILTLGLFTLVVNGALLKIAAALIPGFEVQTWGAAIIGSLVLSIISMVLHWALI